MRTPILLLALGGILFGDTVAGLKFTPPAGWKSEAPRPMRAATYVLPPVGKDIDHAECVVYFFGPGQGGSVEANLERWKGQYQVNGKPAQATINKSKVHSLPVTTLETGGEYSGMGGPTATEKSLKSGYHLLAAIIEGPGGNVFIKFTGPAKTVAANRANFEKLVASFEPAGK
ncbi:MAG: hypothetical protein ABI823_16845 [Bryobacteraceae bacterium]